MCTFISSIHNLGYELNYSQLELLRKGNINYENLIFLSCTELKRYLGFQQLSHEERGELSKLRKSGREKWLYVREMEYLQQEIRRLEDLALSLMEQKLLLEIEIKKLKIMCFLAAPDNALYQYVITDDTMDTA